MRTLRLATRGSPLARRQTELVAAELRRRRPDVEIETVVVRTRGDVEAAAPLDRIGGQGVFVAEVEGAVSDARADAAVHSAKDLPSVMADHLVLAAVPPRADPRDGLVGCALAELPPGGRIATGSARRRAQLAYLRPDLLFLDVRGNMARRVAVGEGDDVDAVVVAVAAMERLGWSARLTDVLDPLDMLPQVGQGAIAVQCRADDEWCRALLEVLDDAASHQALRAERAVLAALGGSCTVPVGAWAHDGDAGEAGGHAGEGGGHGRDGLVVHGLVASGDGRTLIRLTRTGDDPEATGVALARALLRDGGGADIDGVDLGTPYVREVTGRAR